MKTKHYIRTPHGAVSVVRSRAGVTFLVNTTKELSSDDWDQAISQAWDLGYELLTDCPSQTSGMWEFWDLHPRSEAA